jgi:imidazolonepropionase-like amidohydrolase
VIEADGLIAMPGMIDCHDHMASIPGSMSERAQIPPSLAVVRAAATLEDTLRSGLTTIRDASGLDQGLKMAVEQGYTCGPRLQISVDILSQTGGQNCHIEPSGIDSHFPVLPGIPSSICDGPDACRLRAREMVHAGADWIKIATIGGVSTPVGGLLTRQFSREEVAAIVDVAHMRCRLHRSKCNCAPCSELNRCPYAVLVDLASLARGLRRRHLLSNFSIAVPCAVTAAGYRRSFGPRMPVDGHPG